MSRVLEGKLAKSSPMTSFDGDGDCVYTLDC